MLFTITDENGFEVIENKSQIGYNFPIVNDFLRVPEIIPMKYKII